MAEMVVKRPFGQSQILVISLYFFQYLIDINHCAILAFDTAGVLFNLILIISSVIFNIEKVDLGYVQQFNPGCVQPCSLNNPGVL